MKTQLFPKYIICILTILLSYYQVSFSQNYEYHVGGSFAIAAIGSDGIMIAADSRLNFHKVPENPLAYQDGVQKVFIIGTSVVAFLGTASIDGDLLYKVIEDYKFVTPVIPKADLLIRSLGAYVKSHYSEKGYQLFTKNIIISSSYTNGIPRISVYKGEITSQIASIIDSGYVQPAATTFSTQYLKKYNCIKMGKLATEAIYKYAKSSNKEASIGGDIRILKITEKEIVWLKNPPKKQYKTVHELIKAKLSGEIQLKYTSESNKLLYENIFEGKNNVIP